MESSSLKAIKRKQKRIFRIRNRISGSQEKPRLCFVKSNQHISIQVIDDVQGLTLASLTSSSKRFKEVATKKTKTELAKIIGEEIAKICLEKGIKSAVLDRRGCRYHGAIAQFATAARDKGLQF